MSKDFVLNGPFDVELKVHVEAARKHAATIMHMLGLIPEHNAEQFDELQAYIEKALAPAPEDRIERAIDVVANMDWQSSPENIVRALAAAGLLSGDRNAAQPSAPADGDALKTPGELLNRALLDLVRLCVRDGIGDLDLALDGVVADGKDVGDWHLTLRAKSPSPSAGERGWRTIDSALKDKIIWLATKGAMRVGFLAEGKEHEHHGSVGGGWKDFYERWMDGQSRDLRFIPTHWQPVPAAPDTDMGER